MLKKLIVVIAVIIPLTLFSQESNNSQKEYKFGIGAAAGFSTGYGLSFRYWPSNWGLQLTTAPYYSEQSSTISLGITTLRLIKDDGRIRLFGYVGNHLYYEKNKNWYNYPEENQETLKSTTWILGAGPGIEFIIAKKVSFNLMFGIASYTKFSNQYDTNWKLNMTGESALYYRF